MKDERGLIIALILVPLFSGVLPGIPKYNYINISWVYLIN